MKRSLWTRLVSLLLAVVLCVELLPAVGSAVSPSEDLEHTVEGTVEEPAEVAFEEASLRSERVKHFRMGDGSYVAVQYDVPVHRFIIRTQTANGRTSTTRSNRSGRPTRWRTEASPSRPV